MFTKKLAIVSKSAVNRIILKKFLGDKFRVEVFKDLSFDNKKYDLVIVDGFDVDFKNAIVIGKDIEDPGFLSDEFKQQLLDFINEKLGIKKKESKRVVISGDYKYVLIGSSTGGPGLIETIARSLPEDYPHPVCVVQHMPANFTAKFANRLNSVSKVEVVEADNSQPVVPGYFIIAKGGWHLHFRNKEGVVYCKLAPNAKNRFFVPSVDEMFYSALEIIDPKKILAIILTGIGDDGARGMLELKKAGAKTIAESERTAAVYGMPKAAKELGAAELVLDFPDIVREILNFR